MNNKLASVDLGSNTFRLAIGHLTNNQGQPSLQIDDQTRELISLANGLDENNALTTESMAAALDSLSRFGKKLKGFTKEEVRIVATNTFRVATNINELLPKAEQAIGFPIEIISGAEEARLVYLGVLQDLDNTPTQRLVMDIGGGSTEFIIGQGETTLQLASLSMGCTTWTKAFFSEGKILNTNMSLAIKNARHLVNEIAPNYIQTGWQEAYGSSGTAKGVLAVLEDNGYSNKGITLDAMHRLKDDLIEIGQVRLADWKGLKAERAPLLAGGLAILIAAFEELKIETMYAGNGALRIGVLHEMAKGIN